MSPDQFGEALYLCVLGGAVIIWYVSRSRLSLGRVAQQALAWVLIFVAVIAGIGVWEDIRSTIAPHQTVQSEDGKIVVPRARDGHYYLTLQINDAPVTFLVDTGATQVVLTEADARKVGIDMERLIYSGTALTANGSVRTAPVRMAQVRLGPHEDTNVSAWVNGGELDQSLLGMSYLQRWSGLEIKFGELILTR